MRHRNNKKLTMDESDSCLLGEMLLRRRTSLGQKISEIATAAQLSASYYSSIENSKRIPPTSTLRRILDALGFSDAEQQLLRQMAAVERGLSADDADLPDEAQALICDIRRAAAKLPIRFIKALRSEIHEITHL